MKTSFFISYTIRDEIISKELLCRIKSFFLQFGSCYVDIIDNKNYQNKQHRVEEALKDSTYFVQIILPKYYCSPWVQKEIKLAQEYNKHHLLIDVAFHYEDKMILF